MAGQVLNTTININAKGNGFTELGAQIAQIGGMVNGLSTKLIEFGTESLEVYKEYEKSLTDAEVALSTTYGRGSRELTQVMGQLDTAATEWAANTIFHTNDVGNAISEAAHAGWDYQQIMAGIPAAMELAQAGSLDLSQAVNYIVKSTTAAGVSFEDMGNFIDLWAYAANSSASNIDEFGEAMLRMGSTMRFVANPEELFTLIAVTANAGSVGSEAGTMIRNSMLRLIAPTDKAKEAMAELGATAEETAEIAGDEELEAANETLAQLGFSAYDSQGNLKSILDIYEDLYLCLGQVAGSFENIEQNESALQILSAIFPTRTITEALNLLRAASEGYDGLYDSMMGGAAEGYGEYAAATMMDTLYGKIETFGSKMERLKQLVGEQLSPQLENVLGFLGNTVDSVSELDDVKFAALVRGLEGVAAVGPVLLGVGAVVKLIGMLITPAGLAAAGLVSVAAAIGAVSAAAEELYKNNFGELDLDTAAVNAHLQGLRSEFDSTNASVTEFNTALQTVIDTYATDTADLKGTLIQAMLDGTEIKEGTPEYERIMGLGTKIADAVEAGVQLGFSSTLTSLSQTFGGNELGEGIDDGIWAQIVTVMENGMEGELERARSVGQRLRDALTEAFEDGHLTSDEVNNMQNLIDEGNEILAQQQAQERYVEQQKTLRKAQTLGLDAINEAADMVAEQRAEIMEELYQQHDADYWRLAQDYDTAIAEGQMIPNENGIGEHVATEADKTAALARADEMFEQRVQKEIAGFQEYALGIYEAGIQGSDLYDTWQRMEQLGQEFRASGGFLMQDTVNRYLNGLDLEEAEQAGQYLSTMVEHLGGIEALGDYRDYLRDSGELDKAAHMDNVIAMYEATNGGANVSNPIVGIQGTDDYSDVITSTYQQVQALIDGAWGEGKMQVADLADYMQGQLAQGLQPDWSMFLADAYPEFNAAAQRLGMSITEMIADAAGIIPLTPEVGEIEEQEGTVTLTPEVEEIGEQEHELELRPRVEEIGEQETTLTMKPRVGETTVEPQNMPIQPEVGEVDIPPQQVEIEPVVGNVAVSSQPVQLAPYVEDVNVGAQQMEVDPVIGEIELPPEQMEVDPVVDEIPEQQGQVNLTPEVEEIGAQEHELELRPRMGELPDLSGLNVPLPLTPYIDGDNPVEGLQEQGVDVNVNGDTQQLNATIHGFDGTNLMTYVNGDATNLEMAITTQDGRTLSERVTGNTTDLANAIQRFAGQTITVNIRGRQMFAHGGRATEASTFGEAGPEWAIPEQHTINTANLLDQARAASGFSWGELIETSSGGGLNAASKSINQTMVYSPTIYANSAEDLDNTLREDKRRFARWMRETRQRDEMEVFA